MRNIFKKTSVITRTVTLLLLVALFAGGSSLVRADSFDAQIDALNNKNAKNQAALNALGIQANSYQGAIGELQARINALQRSITQNQSQQAALQKQIEAKKLEIARQREVLGDVLRSMYVDGDISTIEMLATSNNLSDYVDKEEYRNSVQNQIQDTLAQIAALQKQLQAKKTKVDELIASQTEQKSQLSADKQKQASLLAYNQQQQDSFTSQIKSNNARIAKLKAAQAVENCRIFGCGGGIAGGGGYPWGYAKCMWKLQNGKCPNYDYAVNGNLYRYEGNGGGWAYRNCTDWVYYRSHLLGINVPSSGKMHSYIGYDTPADATVWDNVARYMGKRVSSTPHKYDTAVKEGSYGHVMFVESVDPDSGDVTISDYNRAGDGNYRISVFPKVGNGEYRNPTSGVVYSLKFVTW